MRLHTNVLTYGDVVNAARAARVDWKITEQGSRSHARSFDVSLRGESRRNAMFSWKVENPYGNEKAATWDQWGVFFSHLFRMDPRMVAGSVKRPQYADNTAFQMQTFARFREAGFPADYHGDHTFRNDGTYYEQQCRKCSARFTWAHLFPHANPV
jgi:hypothetical protein